MTRINENDDVCAVCGSPRRFTTQGVLYQEKVPLRERCLVMSPARKEWIGKWVCSIDCHRQLLADAGSQSNRRRGQRRRI